MINLKPIRLAIIFDQEIHVGGGYQQALNAALIAKKIPEDLAEVLFFTTIRENLETLLSYGINAKIINISFFAKIKNYIRNEVRNIRILKIIRFFEKYSMFEKKLLDNKIDLIYFLSPSNLAQSLEELNYITTVWDLAHREDPEFPEVRFNRELERRETNYKRILPRATAILVDSECGKRNLSHYYGIDLKRIKIMPFEASEATRQKSDIKIKTNVKISQKYQLNVPYIFYPAQFWSHKNHVYLLKGLSILNNKYNISIGAILSGGDKNNRKHVENCAKALNLENHIRFIGFVSNEEVKQLYLQSIALVMPSYFGPTNLPPLEAFNLGVPVLYSNISGPREQVGDAALLMDLKDPNSMAIHLKNLIEDKNIRNQLVKEGQKRLGYFNSYDRVGVLIDIINDFRHKRYSWS